MKLETLRHSTAHLLACVVKELFPRAKLGMGPATEDGFYYDFDGVSLTPEDLKTIEDKMKELALQNIKFERSVISKRKAVSLFKNEKYKLELLKDLGSKVSVYRLGSFVDLCKGPHLKSTKDIRAFKLLRIAGAYWKGSSKNKMLQRIYGTAFPTALELDKHLQLLKEAEERDHRNYGRALDLFSFHEISPGAPFFHPKGAFIYNKLISFLREEYTKRGYEEVITPLLYEKSLWETSGHWQYFKDDMFILNVGGKEYALKPMNCPSHILLYKTRLRSYRELPIRYADFAPLHRNELRGVLGGLTRVNKLSQDDAHIFVASDQLKDEFSRVVEFVRFIYEKVFRFSYTVELSTRPKNAIGSSALWKRAEEILGDVLKKNGLNYSLQKGEGAFYGPKIDFHVSDSIGRRWQLATIQLDFHMPERFKMTYEGRDGRKHTPIMIHRAIFGSLERFMGVLLEHYMGKLPLWLNPVQIAVVTVAERNNKHAEGIVKVLEDNGIRVCMDGRTETIAKKVRDAQQLKPNYIITIGDREVENKTIAVRDRANKVGFGVKVEDFIRQLKDAEGRFE